MSLLSDIAYRNVTEKARELTDEAVSYHWSLQDTLATVMEAWLVTHEERLKSARYEVKDAREQGVKHG